MRTSQPSPITREGVTALQGDVANAEDVERMADVASGLGRLSVWVNNAAVLERTPFAELTPEEWRAVLRVDLDGVFLGCRAAFARFRHTGGGVIVNLASLSGVADVEKFPGLTAYNVAKAGVIALTEAVALEGREHGMRCVCVSPGAVDTALLQQAAPHLRAGMTPDDVARDRRVPGQRRGAAVGDQHPHLQQPLTASAAWPRPLAGIVVKRWLKQRRCSTSAKSPAETASRPSCEACSRSWARTQTREGLLHTPWRVADSLRFLLSGYDLDVADVINGAVFAETYQEMVVVKDIEVYSLCEHHLLPFYGKAHVAYLPQRTHPRAEQDSADHRRLRTPAAGPGAADTQMATRCTRRSNRSEWPWSSRRSTSA